MRVTLTTAEGQVLDAEPVGADMMTTTNPVRDLRTVPWDDPDAVRVLVHDEHDESFTLYRLDGKTAGPSPKE